MALHGKSSVVVVKKKAKLTPIIGVISVEKAEGESLEKEPGEAGMKII